MGLHPFTNGHPRLITESGSGANATRAYVVRYDPHQHMSVHTHASASVSLILSGDCEDTGLNQPSRSCGPLTAMIKPAGVPHETRVGKDGALLLVIQLPDSTMARLIDESVLNEHAVTRCRWWHADDAAATLLSIWLSLAARTLDRDECLVRLSPILHRRGTPSVPTGPVAAAMELLNDGGTIFETARAVGLHPSHLARRFRTQVGITPNVVAQRARLARAVEVISTTSMSLSKCALVSGFTDQAHMTRRLKQAYGVTPSRFRALRGLL